MRWPRSMRQRLTVLIGLMVTLTIGGFAIGFYVMLRGQLGATVDRQLRERSLLIGQAIAQDDPAQPDPPSLLVPPPLVELTTPGLYVAVLGADGQVQSASTDLPTGYLPLDPAVVQAAQAGTETLATVTVGDVTQLRMFVTAVQRPPAGPAVLVVAESLEPLQRILVQTRTLMLWCGLIGIGAAVGGTVLVTQRTFAPILQVTATAHDVAATQQYSRRIPVPPQDDEVGHLAVTINGLIRTVETTLEQQRQLLADTSHELRSPLTAILANLALLHRDLDPAERDLSVTEAAAEAQRMRRLITDLLLLSQPTTTQVLEVQPLALDALLETLVASIRRQWPAYTVIWQGRDCLWIQGDAERLTQSVRNILENAIHHSPAGTTIQVDLRQEDGWAVITISDTGPGIAAEHLPKLWHRFYRVEKARSRRHGGTGLGLAIVQYLVAAHGGTMEVTSTVGVGTTFTMRLPGAVRM